MNHSYISLHKPIEISDMHGSFTDVGLIDQAEVRIMLTDEVLKGLFHEHYSFFCKAAFQIIEDHEAAKDIVQNFFLYCWEKKSTLKIQGSFKSYSYRAIRNASLNYLKRAGRVNYDSDYILQAADKLGYPSEMDALSVEHEQDQLLWNTIDQMPEKRKEIFLLSQKEGLTYAQVAKKLDISVNTVKTQIKLAYVFLRKECRWLVGLIMCFLF